MKRAIHLRNDYARVAALTILFLPHMVEYTLVSLLPAAWGGHPNKWRMLEADFYDVPLRFFLAAMRGEFVR